MAVLIINLLVLPFLDATICGLNNLIAAIVTAIQRSLEESTYSLFDPSTDVRTAFHRILDHIDDPQIKPIILKILDLNTERIEGKSIYDFVAESFFGDPDHSTFPQDERRMNEMIGNFTEMSNRYLSFNDDAFDMSSLESAVDIMTDITDVLEKIESQLNYVYQNIVQPAQSFVDAIVEPFEDISVALEPFQPVIDVFAEITDAISWLKCPKELGFICDLGTYKRVELFMIIDNPLPNMKRLWLV